MLLNLTISGDFNPRSPCGERPPFYSSTAAAKIKISIHAPRVGSDFSRSIIPSVAESISIHAPRVGSDTNRTFFDVVNDYISIHAPRVGSDTYRQKTAYYVGNFNPRSPCGERLKTSIDSSMSDVISIHAPRVGSDNGFETVETTPITISIHAPRVGSDVIIKKSDSINGFISIHAPRVGSDICPGI